MKATRPKLLALLALTFAVTAAVAALPGPLFDGGGCIATGVWTGTGWSSFECTQLASCTTSCEIGYVGPIIDPVPTCKCKGNTDLDPCISVLDLDDDGDITGVSCSEWEDCTPNDWECMHIEDSPNFMPSPGVRYPLCDCYDTP